MRFYFYYDADDAQKRNFCNLTGAQLTVGVALENSKDPKPGPEAIHFFHTQLR